MYPIYMLLVSLSPTFHSIFPTTSLFRVTSHFKESATNNPEITLNPTRSNVLRIHVTTIPGSQRSLRFALRPAILMISHILLFPIDYHVIRPKKKQKKKTLVETLPHAGVYMNFGSKSGAYFQWRCHLKLSVVYGAMLTKTKKKWQKFKF